MLKVIFPVPKICVFKPFCKTKKCVYLLCHFCPSVRPPIRLGQLVSYRVGFREVLCSGLLRKLVDIFELWLNSDRNSMHIT